MIKRKLTTLNTMFHTPAPPAVVRVIPIGALIFAKVRAERVNRIITIHTMTTAAAASAADAASSLNPFTASAPIDT